MGYFLILENSRDEVSKVAFLRFLQLSVAHDSIQLWPSALPLWKAAVGFQAAGTVLEKNIHVYVNCMFISMCLGFYEHTSEMAQVWGFPPDLTVLAQYIWQELLPLQYKTIRMQPTYLSFSRKSYCPPCHNF